MWGRFLLSTSIDVYQPMLGGSVGLSAVITCHAAISGDGVKKSEINKISPDMEHRRSGALISR